MNKWIKGQHEDTQVIMATRVSLYRNHPNLDLLTNKDPKEVMEIRQDLWEGIEYCPNLDTFKIIDLGQVTGQELDAYMHYGYIDASTETFADQALLLLSPSACQAIVLAEKDHFTFRSFSESSDIQSNIKKVYKLADMLHIDYAFHERFGYLTVDPLLAGFAVKVECLVHLAAIEEADEIGVRMALVEEHGFRLLPVLADETAVKSSYILESQLQMGLSEKDLLHRLEFVLKGLESREIELREGLKNRSGQFISKAFGQAWEAVRHSDRLTHSQALEIILDLKLGSDMGYAFFPDKMLALYFDVADSVLNFNRDQDSDEDLDVRRARLLKSRLRR